MMKIDIKLCPYVGCGLPLDKNGNCLAEKVETHWKNVNRRLAQTMLKKVDDEILDILESSRND